MSSFSGKTVLLTGASTGIGRALVNEIIAQGGKVLGIARSEDKLNELSEQHGDRFKALVADLSEADGWQRLVSDLECAPDIVVLNAGTCEYMENGQVDTELVERVFEVNFFANVRAAKELLETYGNEIEQWCVVSSSARYFAMPRGEAYGASKAAISYFFESLQLSYPDIRFSIVHPGFVKTPLTDKNDFDMPMRISAEKAAETIAHKLAKKRLQINVPLFFTVIMRVLGALPARLRYKMGKGLVR